MQTKNKKTPEDFKRFINKIIPIIQQEQGLKDYDIKINFRLDNEKDIGLDSSGTRADIMVDERYLRAELNCYKPLYDEYQAIGNNHVTKIMCHELAHIRTVPLERLARDARDVNITTDRIEIEAEKVTEILGRLMYDSIVYKSFINGNESIRREWEHKVNGGTKETVPLKATDIPRKVSQ